jgi:glutamyl-tRNA(Gln) amidotransferase subunit E
MFDSKKNYEVTREKVGYVLRREATRKTYEKLGFKSGLEVHQQLKTKQKLFCRCPAGRYQQHNEYDAEVIRHMRPTLSEMGEYDGTALMEKKTRKNITYRIKYETACTYDIDDTPPFPLNREALDIALEISLLFRQNLVGEIHITRKQYLDGSIPTGFQRTAIVGIEGELSLKNKKVRLIQLSIEEDSCREVSDIGHERIYMTDRLGMPLIETVTYPELLTPDEVVEAGQYIRYVTRSTGKVRTGIGATRQDVNVSVTGGTRVEIKGVPQILLFPALTHNEAFRQKALLTIKKVLKDQRDLKDIRDWKIGWKEIGFFNEKKLIAVNLPGFAGILSHFTQPGQCFANEISDRLKVIACLEKPNMTHSEEVFSGTCRDVWQDVSAEIKINWDDVRKKLQAKQNDAQIVFWTTDDDLPTAIETIEERCRLAFDGVPNETRRALPGGTTIFERVLPGPDRMYPDTDSAPIPVTEAMIQKVREQLPATMQDQMKTLGAWGAPRDVQHHILRSNLLPLIEKIVCECDQNPLFVATTFAHTLKHLQGTARPAAEFTLKKVYGLFKYVHEQKLHRDILKDMLKIVYEHPNIAFDSVCELLKYQKITREEILAQIPLLKKKFALINTSQDPLAAHRWIMGQLRRMAVGNFALQELSRVVAEYR